MSVFVRARLEVQDRRQAEFENVALALREQARAALTTGPRPEVVLAGHRPPAVDGKLAG